MLTITIKTEEQFNEITYEFIDAKEYTLQLEHSLISLSKWESKWHKPFLECLGKGQLTMDETIDYIKCMTLNSNMDDDIYNSLSVKNMNEINRYISDSMTATTFSDQNDRGRGRDIITAEVIYCSMVMLNIPFECQKWHLNRLMTLIKVCNIKNQPPKKMSTRDIMSRNAALNAARRKQFNSKG